MKEASGDSVNWKFLSKTSFHDKNNIIGSISMEGKTWNKHLPKD
jgi:hypothetical protein